MWLQCGRGCWRRFDVGALARFAGRVAPEVRRVISGLMVGVRPEALEAR